MIGSYIQNKFCLRETERERQRELDTEAGRETEKKRES